MKQVPIITVPGTAVTETAVSLPLWLINFCDAYADRFPDPQADPDWEWEQFKRDIEGQFAAHDVEMGVLP